MWLTRLALRNPILILMVSLIVIGVGLLSLDRLAIDLFPNFEFATIRIVTFYAGAGPQDIEKSITQPIERAVSASPGVERVESTSKQGSSIVALYFSQSTNIDSAQLDVSQRLGQVIQSLPSGIKQPYVLKLDGANLPIASVLVGGEGLDERQLYDLAYNVIQPQIERLTGVANASVAGGKHREVEVRADAEQLRARGIAITEVVDAVHGANLLLPSGNLRAGDREYSVFTNSQVASVHMLEDVVVRPGAATQARGTSGHSSAPVRLAEVASIEDGTAEQTNIVRVNGVRGVHIRVFKQPGANTIGVIDSLRALIPELRGVPATVKVGIAFDQSMFIRSAVRGLEHEALQSGFLAMVVILVFLASVRATAIVTIAIPLSIVATFILLYFCGQSLNIFTLGGLALSIGRLVDDSIVELENIHRHLQTQPNRKKAVLDAAQEVAMPILVSTVTTVIVFLPVVFLTGISKNLFVPLAMTITFALVASFFVSRTVTPLLCLWFLDAGRARTPSQLSLSLTRVLDALDNAYAVALAWVLHRRGFVIASILTLTAASSLLLLVIGTEFLPPSDESQVSISYKAPIGTRVERTEELSKRIEEASTRTLVERGKSIVSTTISNDGLPTDRGAVFTGASGSHAGGIQINLVPPDKRKASDAEAVVELRAALKDLAPGARVEFYTGGLVKRVLTFGTGAPIDVEVLGYDLEQSSTYGRLLVKNLSELTDRRGRLLLTDVAFSREENAPELDVTVDREKAGVLGLTQQQIALTVLTSLVGSEQYAPIPFTDRITGNEYPINIRLDDAHRSHVSDLGDVFMKTRDGAMVPLNYVAKVVRSSGPVTITRKYLQRMVDVTANPAPGVDLGTASAAVEKLVADTPPPDGFEVRISGLTLAQKEAFSGLKFALVMALALVYMILASQFKSLIDPLVILFSVPLGVSGVFIVLWATKTTLNVNSAMGIIMMVGIVVSNGVLLVDYANVLRRRGLALYEATILAAKTRLRPILMTTVATVVGLVPMALAFGEATGTNVPLARAVIGGLAVSTVFTLFLIPCLYTLLERYKRTDDETLDDDGSIDVSV